MKIATWNVERLKHKNSLQEMLAVCEKVQADVLVLTETDQQLQPDYKYCFRTAQLSEKGATLYKKTENRVSIYTNYPCVLQYETFDKDTAVCVELETERGNILVYGTIIGIYGNRHLSFMADLRAQMSDLYRIAEASGRVCFCGDFNCSFSDNYYFTEAGRNILLDSFMRAEMSILTAEQPECIDHVAVSKKLLTGFIEVEEWNEDKRLSDHKGIAVTL